MDFRKIIKNWLNWGSKEETWSHFSFDRISSHTFELERPSISLFIIIIYYYFKCSQRKKLLREVFQSAVIDKCLNGIEERNPHKYPGAEMNVSAALIKNPSISDCKLVLSVCQKIGLFFFNVISWWERIVPRNEVNCATILPSLDFN